jgi:hypothetical protein
MGCIFHDNKQNLKKLSINARAKYVKGSVNVKKPQQFTGNGLIKTKMHNLQIEQYVTIQLKFESECKGLYAVNIYQLTECTMTKLKTTPTFKEIHSKKVGRFNIIYAIFIHDIFFMM